MSWEGVRTAADGGVGESFYVEKKAVGSLVLMLVPSPSRVRADSTLVLSKPIFTLM